MLEPIFLDKDHAAFYNEHLPEAADCYDRALIYTLGLTDETRRNFAACYGDGSIHPDCLTAGWQTGTSARVTRMAFNLWNGYRGEPGEEAPYYTPEYLFCCGMAPYFFIAIRLRYPEYCRPIATPNRGQ